MRNKFRLAVLGVVAAAVPALAAAPSAMAANSVHCTYQGSAATSGVGVMANTGTFTFTQTSPLTFTCTGQLNSGQYAGSATLVVPASGTFNNTVCGTGTADGSGSVTATAVAGSLAAGLNGGSVSFHIQFVAGNGAITGTATGPAGSASITGSTTIVATGGGGTPNATYCTDNFSVAGTNTLT
jgi:hypothetical protein